MCAAAPSVKPCPPWSASLQPCWCRSSSSPAPPPCACLHRPPLRAPGVPTCPRCEVQLNYHCPAPALAGAGCWRSCRWKAVGCGQQLLVGWQHAWEPIYTTRLGSCLQAVCFHPGCHLVSTPPHPAGPHRLLRRILRLCAVVSWSLHPPVGCWQTWRLRIGPGFMHCTRPRRPVDVISCCRAEVAGRLYRASYRHMAHFTLLLILFAAAAYKSEVRWMGVRSVCKLKRCVTTLPALAVACVNLCTATADLEGQLQQLTAFVAAPPSNDQQLPLQSTQPHRLHTRPSFPFAAHRLHGADPALRGQQHVPPGPQDAGRCRHQQRQHGRRRRGDGAGCCGPRHVCRLPVRDDDCEVWWAGGLAEGRRGQCAS